MKYDYVLNISAIYCVLCYVAPTWTEQRACPSWPCSPRSPAGASSDTPPVWRWPPPAASTCQKTTVTKTVVTFTRVTGSVTVRHSPVCPSPWASSPSGAAGWSWSLAPPWGFPAPAPGTVCESPSAGTRNKARHHHVDVASFEPAGGAHTARIAALTAIWLKMKALCKINRYTSRRKRLLNNLTRLLSSNCFLLSSSAFSFSLRASFSADNSDTFSWEDGEEQCFESKCSF